MMSTSSERALSGTPTTPRKSAHAATHASERLTTSLAFGKSSMTTSTTTPYRRTLQIARQVSTEESPRAMTTSIAERVAASASGIARGAAARKTFVTKDQIAGSNAS